MRSRFLQPVHEHKFDFGAVYTEGVVCICESDACFIAAMMARLLGKCCSCILSKWMSEASSRLHCRYGRTVQTILAVFSNAFKSIWEFIMLEQKSCLLLWPDSGSSRFQFIQQHDVSRVDGLLRFQEI